MKNEMKPYLPLIALSLFIVFIASASGEIYSEEDIVPVFDKEAAAQRKLLLESQGYDQEDNAAEVSNDVDEGSGGNDEEAGEAEPAPVQAEQGDIRQEAQGSDGDGEGDAAAEGNFDDIWQGRTFGAMFEPVQMPPQSGDVATKEKPVVSVIVNILPPEHFASVYKELSRLKKIYNAQIGRVVVLGLSKAQKEDKKRKQEELIAKQNLQQEDFDYLDDVLVQEKQLDELGLKNKGSVDFEEMFGKLSAEVSPTWIIHHQEMDYVYEGINNPSKLFTGKGEFKEDFSLKMNVSGDTPDDIIVREKVRGVSLYKDKPERGAVGWSPAGGAVKQPTTWDAVSYE